VFEDLRAPAATALHAAGLHVTQITGGA
jgi:hypothetical protein